MSGTQVVSQETTLQRIKMGVSEGPSSQPVTIAPLTEVNGTLTGLPSQALTIPSIRHHLRPTLLLPGDTTRRWRHVSLGRLAKRRSNELLLIDFLIIVVIIFNIDHNPKKWTIDLLFFTMTNRKLSASETRIIFFSQNRSFSLFGLQITFFYKFISLLSSSTLQQ